MATDLLKRPSSVQLRVALLTAELWVSFCGQSWVPAFSSDIVCQTCWYNLVDVSANYGIGCSNGGDITSRICFFPICKSANFNLANGTTSETEEILKQSKRVDTTVSKLSRSSFLEVGGKWGHHWKRLVLAKLWGARFSRFWSRGAPIGTLSWQWNYLHFVRWGKKHWF